MTFLAICNVNGPISVILQAQDKQAAIEEFERLDTREVIDDPRMDAEDLLDIDGDGMTENEFDEALMRSGATPLESLDLIVNAHAGTAAHLADGWYLWIAE